MDIINIGWYARGRRVGGIHGDYIRRRAKYKELMSVKGWRGYMRPIRVIYFEFQGLRWRTIRHYIVACRIKCINKNLYYNLSMTSKSPLSRMPARTIFKILKPELRKLSPEQNKKWFKKRSVKLTAALIAQFSSNETARKVLLATKDAVIIQKYKNFDNAYIELMRAREHISAMET